MTFDSRFKKEFLEISSEDQRQEIQNNFVNEEQEAEHLEYLNESISELKESIPSLDFESSIHRSILSSVVGGINLYLEEKLQELIQQDLENSNYLTWPSDTYLSYIKNTGNTFGSQYTVEYFSVPNTPVYRIRNYCEHNPNSSYCFDDDIHPVYTPVYNNEPIQNIVVSNISGGTFAVSEQIYNELGTYGTVSEIVTDEDTGNVTLSLINYNSEFSAGDLVNNGLSYSTLIKNSNFTDDINFWNNISSENNGSKIEWVDSSSLKISYDQTNTAGAEQSFSFDNFTTEDTYKLIMSITPTSDIETLDLEFYEKNLADDTERLLNSLTILGSDSNFDPTQSLYELNLNFSDFYEYNQFRVEIKYSGSQSTDFDKYVLINSISLTDSDGEDIIIIQENVTGVVDSVSTDQTPDSLYLHDQERIKIPYQINYCYTGIDLKESRKPANDPFSVMPTEPNIRKTVEDYRLIYGNPNDDFSSILAKSTYFDGLDEDNHRTSIVGEQDIILSNISGGGYLIGDIISNENGISGVVKQITFETDESENVLKTIISMEIYTSIFSAGDLISNSSNVTANIDSVINTRTVLGEKRNESEDPPASYNNYEFFDISPEIFYIEPIWVKKTFNYMTDEGPKTRETFPELQNRKVVVINKDNDETLKNLIDQAKVVYELYEEMLNGVEDFTGSYSETVFNFQAIEETLKKKERYTTRNQILREFSGLTTSSQ